MKLPKTIEEVREFANLAVTNERRWGNTLRSEMLLKCFEIYAAKHKKKSKWIKWDGGEKVQWKICPVDWNEMVRVKYKDGSRSHNPVKASGLVWWNSGLWCDIIAYKIVRAKL